MSQTQSQAEPWTSIKLNHRQRLARVLTFRLRLLLDLRQVRMLQLDFLARLIRRKFWASLPLRRFDFNCASRDRAFLPLLVRLSAFSCGIQSTARVANLYLL